MAPPNRTAVFINAPFDKSYESLFVTLVGALVFLGQEPHCVLEVPEKGEGRLARIFDLMHGLFDKLESYAYREREHSSAGLFGLRGEWV